MLRFLGLSRVPPHERLLNGPVTSVRWWLANHTVDCIYPWMHSCKTYFHMTSNVWVSGVKLRSFAAQMWSVVLNDFRNCTLIFAQLLRKNNPAYVLSLNSANRWKWDAFLIILSLLVDQNHLPFEQCGEVKLHSWAGKLERLTPETQTFDVT